jgi:lysophospholipase L1-like esterase
MTITALWVGDSFTVGEGAGVSAGSTYPFLVSERLGWRCAVDAQCGTGFLNDGWAASADYARLLGRLPTTAREVAADVVVVDAGRNDAGYPEARLRRALVCSDGFHPSAAGQARYAQVLVPALRAALAVPGAG